MPFIEVKRGGQEIPKGFTDGVYPVILTEISDPKTVTAQQGPKAGQDIELIDWTFAIDDGEFESTIVEASTSTASGPKSKMYAFLTALLGGRPPAVGQTFEKGDLVGRRALATVHVDEAGWIRIDNLGAMPASMLGARVAKATGAPTNEPVAEGKPLREAVAAGDVPF